MILLGMMTIAAFGLGEIPQQSLGKGQCRTFLWTKTEPPMRVAMVDEGSRMLRIVRNGKPLDLPAVATPGTYVAGALTVTLDLSLADRPGLSDGNIVEQGSIRLEEAGRDSIILPVGGIRGCG